MDGAEVFERLLFIASQPNGDERSIACLIEQIRILGIKVAIDLRYLIWVGLFKVVYVRAAFLQVFLRVVNHDDDIA